LESAKEERLGYAGFEYSERTPDQNNLNDDFTKLGKNRQITTEQRASIVLSLHSCDSIVL